MTAVAATTASARTALTTASAGQGSAAAATGDAAGPQDAFSALLQGLNDLAAQALPDQTDTGAAIDGQTAEPGAEAAAEDSLLPVLADAALLVLPGAAQAAPVLMATVSMTQAASGLLRGVTGTGPEAAQAPAEPGLTAATQAPAGQTAGTTASAKDATSTAPLPGGTEALAAASQPPTPSRLQAELSALMAAQPERTQGSEEAGLTALPETAPLTAPASAAMVDFQLARSEAAAPTHRALLASHPQEAAFAGDLAAEVKLLVSGGLQQAELRLNPAELGPIHIQLSVTAQTADISFAAAHSMTREGIAQSLPQLRDMLASQGLQLGQAGVSGGQDGQQQQQQAHQAEQARRGQAHPQGGRAGTGSVAMTGLATVRAPRGMLDLYA